MPKARNEVIHPEQGELDNQDAAYIRLDAKQALLKKKLKLLEPKLKIAQDEEGPEDVSHLETKVDYWEEGMQNSINKQRDSVAFQENQILQSKAAYEQRLATMENRLRQAKDKLVQIESFWAQRIAAAQAKVEHSKRKVSPKLRKMELEKEAIEEEINAIQLQKDYHLKMEVVTNIRKEKKAVVVEYDSDEDYDEDKHGDMEYDGRTGFKAWSLWRMARGKDPY